MKWKLEFDSAVLLALLTAFLYASGYAHYNGMLLSLELDTTVLDRGFNSNVYNGFLQNIGFLLAYLFIAFAILFSFINLPVYFFIKFLKSSTKNKRIYLKFKNIFIGDRDSSIIEKVLSKFIIKIAFIFIASLLLFVFLLHSEKKGKEEADKFLSWYNSNEEFTKKNIKVEIDGSSFDLVLITCGASNCAAIQRETNNIYYFGVSLGYQDVSNNKIYMKNSTDKEKIEDAVKL